jgi:hypothetical protein
LVKSPGANGIVTITPGTNGFTLDQGSHNPVTLGAGTTGNGLTLSNQVLSLSEATTTTGGALNSTDKTILSQMSYTSGTDTLTLNANLNITGRFTSQNNILCFVRTTATSVITTYSLSDSIFNSSRIPTSVTNVNPVGIYGFNSSQGIYYAPISGYYFISVYVRSGDDSGSAVGVRPAITNSSGTITNYIIGNSDRSYWMSPDPGGRRCMTFTEIVYMSAGQGFIITGYNPLGPSAIYIIEAHLNVLLIFPA